MWKVAVNNSPIDVQFSRRIKINKSIENKISWNKLQLNCEKLSLLLRFRDQILTRLNFWTSILSTATRRIIFKNTGGTCSFFQDNARNQSTWCRILSAFQKYYFEIIHVNKNVIFAQFSNTWNTDILCRLFSWKCFQMTYLQVITVLWQKSIWKIRLWTGCLCTFVCIINYRKQAQSKFIEVLQEKPSKSGRWLNAARHCAFRHIVLVLVPRPLVLRGHTQPTFRLCTAKTVHACNERTLAGALFLWFPDLTKVLDICKLKAWLDYVNDF